MSDDHDHRRLNRDETRLLFHLRVVSGFVVLGCLILLVISSILSERLQLHVSELLFGSLVGALLALVGLSVPNLPWNGGGR